MKKEKIKKIYAGLCVAWAMSMKKVPAGDGGLVTTFEKNSVIIQKLQEYVGEELSHDEREYIEENCDDVFYDVLCKE